MQKNYHAALIATFKMKSLQKYVQKDEFEHFGSSGSYLVSDYSVEKSSEEYRAVFGLALVAIGLYAVGIPLLYGVLLFKAAAIGHVVLLGPPLGIHPAK